MKTVDIAIFVSGNGTNCENIIRYFKNSPKIRIKLVLSNRSDAYALTRAQNLGVPTEVVNKAQLNDNQLMMDILQKNSVDFIVLAGFLPIIPDFIVNSFPNRIVNIHPSLLPKYGGKGMWGHHVHEAVKAAGETESGITIHYVNNVCDGGEIIKQVSVPLTPQDSAEDIADKVHELEMKYFPEVLERIFLGIYA